MRNLFRLLAVAAVISLPAPEMSLAGHHSAATFDTKTEVILKGTVTEWLWFNPHCFLRFDVKEASGEVKNWSAETGNPTDMTKRGWARTSLKPGDQVTVTLQPARNGSPVGRLTTVVLASGQTFK